MNHLAQAKEIIVVKEPFTLQSRILKEDAPTKKYRRRQGEKKSVLHWGQRKLLMAEIEFMTLYSRPTDIVIYAGAAPGTHISYLARLFPDNHFVLVDPSNFIVQPSAKIEIHQQFFTDDFARELRKRFEGKRLLFLSDIRSASWKTMSSEEVEKYVERDMRAQERWVKILSPEKSMLKFRLPYTLDDIGTTKYEYLDGIVFLPVWGGQTTSETRLVVDKNASTRIWNPVKYEDQMFYFNTITRVKYYPHDIKWKGYDHCYDCRSEIFILEQYLKKYGGDTSNIVRMAKEITQELTRKPMHVILEEKDFEAIEKGGLLNYRVVPKNKEIKSLVFYRPTCLRSKDFLEKNKDKKLYLVNVDIHRALAYDYGVTNILPHIIDLS